MSSLALAINLVLFAFFTGVLIALSISERKEGKKQEEFKKAA